jgi:hypothetical protein
VSETFGVPGSEAQFHSSRFITANEPESGTSSDGKTLVLPARGFLR